MQMKAEITVDSGLCLSANCFLFVLRIFPLSPTDITPWRVSRSGILFSTGSQWTFSQHGSTIGSSLLALSHFTYPFAGETQIGKKSYTEKGRSAVAWLQKDLNRHLYFLLFWDIHRTHSPRMVSSHRVNQGWRKSSWLLFQCITGTLGLRVDYYIILRPLWYRVSRERFAHYFTEKKRKESLLWHLVTLTNYLHSVNPGMGY